MSLTKRELDTQTEYGQWVGDHPEGEPWPSEDGPEDGDEGERQ